MKMGNSSTLWAPKALAKGFECQTLISPRLMRGVSYTHGDMCVRCREAGIIKWAEIANYLPGRLGKQVNASFNDITPLKRSPSKLK
jgi:hypothetical protein